MEFDGFASFYLLPPSCACNDKGPQSWFDASLTRRNVGRQLLMICGIQPVEVSLEVRGGLPVVGAFPDV